MKNSPKISNGVHFIGIGGIGVSALAKYYLEKGHEVSGSDLVSSEITESLKKRGVKIFIGKHKAENLPKDCSLVIYSPAIQRDNSEFKKAKKLGIICQSYPEALGELTKKYFTIAVSGTHGKSTTTAMIGLLLVKAGLDPTIIVGTRLREFGNSTRSTSSGLILSHTEGSNCRVGESLERPRPQIEGGANRARKYLVIEADEHLASFLNYWPKIIVLTNIEREHLDYYGNLKNILKAYKEYISHLPKDGVLIVNGDDSNLRKLLKTHDRTFPTIVENVLYYSVNGQGREVKKIKEILKIPGEHNVSNALAALRVARILKIPDKISFESLSQYKGAWRRFEIKRQILNRKPLTLISDYGHHPTEIKVTLKAARGKFPKKEIYCIFQPHQYQRTYYLFKDFVRVLKTAPVDKLIITDIYDVAGRESKKIRKKVNSQRLVNVINKKSVIYLTKKEILAYLEKTLKGGEVVIIMGAGDIYDLTLRLTRSKIR